MVLTAIPTPASAGESIPFCSLSLNHCGWLPATLPGNLSYEETELNSVLYVGSSILAAGGQGTILRSTNGGVSYSLVPSPVGDDDITTLTKDTYGQLWAVTVTGGFYVSTDGGLSWAASPSSGLTGNVSHVAFISSTFALATSDQGLFFSTDNGQQWTRDSALGPGWARAAACYDPEDCWVSFGNEEGIDIEVEYTNDGGRTWSMGNISDTPPAGAEFVPTGPTSAWFLGEDGSVYYTTNGLLWTVSDHPIGEKAYQLALVNNTYLWEVAQDGNIYYTPNAGGCWIEQPMPTNEVPDLTAIAFRDNNHGVMLGSGTAFYTSNGGNGTTDSYSPLSSAVPGPTLGDSASPAPAHGLWGYDSDDGPLPPCTSPPPYSIDVVATAVGVGIGAGIFVGIRMRTEERKFSGPPRAPEIEGKKVKQFEQKLRYKSARKRYVQR